MPNSSFEQLDANGTITHWNSIYLVNMSDSIIYDSAFYFPTTDAHTGLRAMEMRNAYNYTTGQQIAGYVKVSDINAYGGFGSQVSLGQSPPTHFSFYYKFFPAGVDTAVARMTLTDSTGNEVGNAEIAISHATSVYSLAVTSVTYTNVGFGQPAFFSILLSTSKSGTLATLGTRFLVDDINMATVTGLSEQTRDVQELHCFPNPVGDRLSISLKNTQIKNGSIRIADINGRCLLEQAVITGETLQNVDVSHLCKGVYFVTLSSSGQVVHSQFVK